MNSTIKKQKLIRRKDDVKDTSVYFIIEFYKQKPHWDTEYYDVLSGCKDTFDDYKKEILKDKISVKASFELKDFENALFRIEYKKYNINPIDIAYIKIIDDCGIFQNANWKNTYFFITNVSFASTEIAILYGQLDIWMTYWPQLKFNGKSIKCLRKHMPRYRTDESHKGEYDFSTDSCILNVDQIEGQFTNLVSFQNWPLQSSLKGREDYLTSIKATTFSNNDTLWTYCLLFPKDADMVMNDTQNWNFIKVGDLISKGNDVEGLKYLYVDNDGISQGKVNSANIKGCPWFVFSVAKDTVDSDVWVWLKAQLSPRDRQTYIAYNYQELCFLGDRIANVFFVDHPIFYYNLLEDTKQLIASNVVYIDGVSQKSKGKLPDNIQEITAYTFDNFDNLGWYYEPYLILQHELPWFYKPLKEYTENDKISLDQEPALFRTPHFEFEYSIYTAKGILKIQNELLLSEGYFKEYGGLFCDYIVHSATIQKYLYVKNGWYREQYNLWKFGLFEENTFNFDLISEAYQKFLQQNQNQFNNSYNQSMINGFLGIAEAGIGLALAPFTGGLSAAAGMSLAVGAGLSVANNAKNMYFTTMSREAQIKDLQRTPATRINNSNSFSNTALNQMKNFNLLEYKPAKGFILARQHRENEQWILYTHFHQNGYLVNKILAIKDLNWFYSRHWFDFFQIEDFTTVIDNTKYSQYILNKFNNIFHRGVRLWHTIEHFLDYSLNNKEIDDWKEIYLKR